MLCSVLPLWTSKLCPLNWDNVGGTPGPGLGTTAVDLVQQCLLIFYTGTGSGSFFPILFFSTEILKRSLFKGHKPATR